MTDALGQRVRLKLKDPDAGYASRLPVNQWPVVEGRLVASVPGLHGLTWHLLELIKPLPRGFDPLGRLGEGFGGSTVRYLLLSPSPNIPTGEIRKDFIAEGLARREIVPVGVSIGVSPNDVPMTITLDNKPCFPWICSGDLEAL